MHFKTPILLQICNCTTTTLKPIHTALRQNMLISADANATTEMQPRIRTRLIAVMSVTVPHRYTAVLQSSDVAQKERWRTFLYL